MGNHPSKFQLAGVRRFGGLGNIQTDSLTDRQALLQSDKLNKRPQDHYSIFLHPLYLSFGLAETFYIAQRYEMWNELSKSRSSTYSTKQTSMKPTISLIKHHFIQYFLSWLLLKSSPSFMQGFWKGRKGNVVLNGFLIQESWNVHLPLKIGMHDLSCRFISHFLLYRQFLVLYKRHSSFFLISLHFLCVQFLLSVYS